MDPDPGRSCPDALMLPSLAAPVFHPQALAGRLLHVR